MRGVRLVAVLGLVVGAVACAATQQDADQALKETESAITAQHAEAIRFAPNAFAAVMQAYSAARKSYDAKDWAAAIAGAQDAATKARQLPAAITEGRDRAVAAWPTTQDSVRRMLAVVGERVGELERTRRYPIGVTAQDVAQARGMLDSLTASWDRAVREFETGDMAGALHASDQVKVGAGMLKSKLGMQPRNPHAM
jgi:hypothetical protein